MAIPLQQVPLYDMRQNQIQQDMAGQVAPQPQQAQMDWGAILKKIRKSKDDKTLLMAEVADAQKNAILESLDKMRGQQGALSPQDLAQFGGGQ